MEVIRARDGMSPRALELMILTATRTSETLGALWDEINLKQATWTIKAERMKSGREHRIPLSPRAVAILEEMTKIRRNGFVLMALAHAVADGVEAAYRRGDLFEKRRKLMEAWAAYCGRRATGADVVPLRRTIK